MKTTRPVSMLQFTLMVSTFQISVAFLALPRELAKYAGTDGWIAIFGGWGLATLASIALIKVMKNSPTGSILELIQRFMGVWASKIAAVIFIAYFLLLAYHGYMIATLVIKLWLLPSTYLYIPPCVCGHHQNGKGGTTEMKWFQTFFAVMSFALFLALLGCSSDKKDLEDATVPLALGLDVRDEKLRYYISAPVFSKDIKKKSREGEGIAAGLRQSRNQQDAQFSGAVSGRNYQVIIVGKQLLQYKDWFRILDVKFRDPRNTVTDRIIAYDGSVADIIHFQSKEQPPIPVFLRGLIDSGSSRSTTVKTSEQDLHRQLHDRALTPSISEIMIENGKILLKGTALLSHEGQYRDSLSYQETSLMQILRKEAKPGVSLTFSGAEMSGDFPFRTDLVSFSIDDVSVKIKTSHQDGKFQYHIKIYSFISITEKLLEYGLLENSEEMANKLSEKMKKSIEKLIEKFQQHKIDPVGFGLYARAYHYPLYKAVQNNWGEELARANFHVEVNLRIGATGAAE